MRLFIVRATVLFLLMFFLFPKVGQSVEPLSVSSNNAVLIEESTGRVLYEKQAHDRKPVASITKLMTAIVAIEEGNLKDTVKASERAIHTEGSSIYLQKGEKMSLEDLLYGLMLRSGNDASVAIAEHIGESVEGFVYMMNEKATYLGMTNTHFSNPHGLDEEDHYSSAYDMAILMQYAMKNETFKEISAAKEYKSEKRSYKWKNKNKLLTQLYSNATGGKTGFTKKAGRTLVTTAKKDGLPLIAVTLNGPDDWNDHTALYEWGFKEHELVKLERKGERTFVSKETFHKGTIKDDVVYPLHKDELKRVRKQAIIKQASESENPDKQIGLIVYKLGDEKLLEVPVYPAAGKEKKTIVDHLSSFIKKIIRFDKDG